MVYENVLSTCPSQSRYLLNISYSVTCISFCEPSMHQAHSSSVIGCLEPAAPGEKQAETVEQQRSGPSMGGQERQRCQHMKAGLEVPQQMDDWGKDRNNILGV